MRFDEPLIAVPVYETDTSTFGKPISYSVLNCAADCKCVFHGSTEPHSPFTEVEPQTGQVIVKSFPPNNTFTAGRYTTRLTVVCTSSALDAEARTTVVVDWHPIPRFRQPTAITILGNTPLNTWLTLLAPENQFPYQLQYTTTSSAVEIDPDTGAVTLLTALLPGSYPIVFTVSEVAQAPVNVSLNILVTSGFQSAKFRENEVAVVCDSLTGEDLSVDLGTDTAADVEFDIFGEQAKCVVHQKVTLPQPGGGFSVSVNVQKRPNTFCGVTFEATLILHSSSGSSDAAVLKFSGCPAGTETE